MSAAGAIIRALRSRMLGLCLARPRFWCAWARRVPPRRLLRLQPIWSGFLSLLGVSYRDQVPPGIVKNIEKASEQWGLGEKALAHIHLAFTGLPRLESANDAYRLYLAEALLDDGLPPREMLAELGLFRAMRQLDKFDPDQPHVPAGSGRESGQWTKDGSLTSTSAGEDHKVQLAGDVIHVGTLVGISISGAPGEIPRTTCIYLVGTWRF